MMRRKRFIILLVFLIFLLAYKVVNSQNVGDVTFIEKVVMAEPSDYPEENYWESPFTVQEGNIWMDYSYDKKYAIYLKNERKTLVVRWRNIESTLNSDEDYFYIRWRPGYSSFVYSRAEEDEDGGDIGACSFHYVDVKEVNGKLELIEKTLVSYSFDSDFAWSSDGKYFAYCDGWSLRIRNFETGREWATKQIHEIDNDNNYFYLYPNVFIVGIKWIEDDQKIFLLYKDTPGVDMVYAVEIDLKQFDLQ